jgi:hypothetical protein
MSEYKLVVIPETPRLSARLTQSLEDYARAGGLVVLSGDHLARDYSALVGASARGAVLAAPIHLRVGNAAVPVSGPWQAVTPAPGTQALAVRLTERDPQRNSTDQVVVTKRPLGQGAIVAIHGPVFRDYNLGHYPLLRQFLGDLVSGLNVPWRVTVEASPRLEVIVRQKDGRLLVNLLNRGAGEMLSHHRVIVEELAPIENVIVRIRQDHPPKSIYSAPGSERVEWSFDRGVVTARVPRVEIHQVLVVE